MNYLSLDIASALGTAVLHSLWQGAAVYCLFRLVVQRIKDPARIHTLGMAGLAAMTVGFAVTLLLLWPTAVQPGTTGTIDFASIQLLANATQSPAPAASWAALLGYGYAIGVFVYLTWLGIEHWRTWRLLRTARVELPQNWRLPFDAAVARLVPHLRVGVHLSRHVTTVVTVGILRPVVLFPVALANRLSIEEAELILLHELAHLRRYDHFTVYVQQLLRALLFFHPAAHLLSGEVDRAREFACDDLAIVGGSKKAYAKTLVHLATHSLSVPQNHLIMSISKTPFSARIHRLFGAHATAKLPGALFVLPLVLFALTVYAVVPSTPADRVADDTALLSLPIGTQTDTVPSVEPSTSESADLDADYFSNAERIPSEQEIEDIVAEAMRNMPTEAELQNIIADAMKSMPSAAEIEAQVREAMKAMPSEAEMERMIEDANKSIPSEAELRRIIESAMDSMPDRAEIERITKEAQAQRRQAEELRLQAEELRSQAEELRLQADVQRSQADVQRLQADAQRLQADAQRRQAQTQRSQAEEQRLQAEAQRLQADAQTLRITTTGTSSATRTTVTDSAGTRTSTTSSGPERSVTITADPNAKDIDYFIDGRVATVEEVNALNPDTIERVDVVKNEGERKVVRVFLKG